MSNAALCSAGGLARAGCTALIVAAACALQACRGERTARSDAAIPSLAPSAAKGRAQPALAPLTADSWRIDLPVPGFGAASLAVPLGAREPRPIIIALHGHDDRPDWECGTWTGISDARAFVLCPRGVPGSTSADGVQRFTFGDAASTESELRAALKALKQRFGAHVAPGPVVLAGYSLGAVHAARIARLEPSFFARLVLIEGAYERWSAGDAAVFAKSGGAKLLAVCSQQGCARAASRAVLFTRRAGADAELVDAGALGHVFDGRVAHALKERFEWLIAGDERWPRPKTVSAQAVASAAPKASVEPPSDARLPPLAASAPLVPLAVEGFRDAVVSVPSGATSARPVLVALHGNYDRPEWQCEVWRSLVDTAGFVLCPRGVPRAGAPKEADRWEYGSGPKTRAELDAALAALKARFGEYVADGALVFTGFSLGAILGVRIVQENAARFPRVVLTEGGQTGWNASTATAFKSAGGDRILFACGQSGCAQSSRALAKTLEKHGLPARVAFGGNVGHTYDGPVARAIGESWAWLVEGDPRWAAARVGPP